MRTIRNVVLVIVLAFALIGVYFLARHFFSAPGAGASPALYVEGMEWQDAPPLPALSLQIDNESQLNVFQGSPLIITVREANPRAANAVALARAHAAYSAQIQEQVARGEITAAGARPMLELARHNPPVRMAHIETADRGWETFIRFELESPGGAPQPLPWPLRLLSKTVASGPESSGQIDYALSPEDAAQVPAGVYSVVAVLEVPAGVAGPADLWHGRVASSAVALTVYPSPARPSPSDRAKLNLARAEYFSVIKDWGNALSSAQAALAADPNLVRAHMAAGHAMEAQGNSAGARDAFLAAKSLFEMQNPTSYEAPRHLIRKIAELDALAGAQ